MGVCACGHAGDRHAYDNHCFVKGCGCKELREWFSSKEEALKYLDIRSTVTIRKSKTWVCGGCGERIPYSKNQEWSRHRATCKEKWRKLKAGEPAGDRVE